MSKRTVCPSCQKAKGGDNNTSIALFSLCCACYHKSWQQHTAHLHYDGSDDESNDYQLAGKAVWIGLNDPNTNARGADIYIALDEEGVCIELYGRIGLDGANQPCDTAVGNWADMAAAVKEETA